MKFCAQALVLVLGMSCNYLTAAREIDQSFLYYQPRVWNGTPCWRTETSIAEGRDASMLPTQPGMRAASYAGKDLGGVDFSTQDLSGVDFKGSNLRSAGFLHTTLKEAIFERAHLERSDFTTANLQGAMLDGAHLDCVILEGADLTGASMMDSESRSLTGYSSEPASLRGADLRHARLAGARFDKADVSGAIFEPNSIPDADGMAGAVGLEQLTYEDRPEALYKLRKEFQEAGFSPQERKITYALNKREAQLDEPPERWFKTAAFDWTSQYGMSPGRPLRIIFVAFVICWVLYGALLRFTRSSLLYRVGEESATKNEEAPIRIELQRVERGSSLWSYAGRKWLAEMNIVYWAGIFSLRTAVNLGYQEIHLGRWLKLLSRRNFELRSEGWIRTISGVQALLSMYLIALWLLTYFGHPFG